MSNNSLKELRRSNGLKQKDVAEKLNMTVSSYAKIERGERNLSIDMEQDLADLYNVDIEVINNLCTKRTMLKEGLLDIFEEPKKLDVCYSKIESTATVDDYKELFIGFDNMRVITFSSSAAFIAKMIRECSFNSVDIIFGNKKVFDGMPYMKELIMDSNAIINVLVGNEPDYVDYLKKRLSDNSLNIYIANPNALSHEKIYILWNDSDNKVRVITGSANMTLRAYSGRQKENIIVYDNDDTAFDYFYNRFDSFLENTICKIEPQRMKKLTSENLVSDNPIIVGVVETKNTIYVDTTMEDDTEDFDGYYATNKENMKAILDKYTETMEKSFFENKADARNVLALSPEKCKSVINSYKLSLYKDKQKSLPYPEFRVEPDMKAFFNNEFFATDYKEDNVINDIKIFKNFFSGYHNGSFVGSLEQSLNLAVEKYYASVIYGFISPFMHFCIKLSGNGVAPYSFPGYLILRGPKSAGKTPFCSFLLKLMFRQYKLNFDEMSGLMRKSENVSPKEGLIPAMLSGQGFPVVIDELTRGRAKDYEGVIKNPEIFKAPCSCVIFTCNDDFEISDYIVKRSVLFNIDISNNGSGNQKVNSFISNLNNLTGDLYKCFYSRFSQRFQELLNELSEIRYSNESKNKDIPDIFKLGSEVLKDIFEEYDSIDDASYIKVYDSSFFRDGKSNLDERKKKFIDDFEFGDWKLDTSHNLLFKVFDGFDGKSKAKEFADAMNQYGNITAVGNKVRIKLDWAKEFFDYDFIEHCNDITAPERIVERVIEKPIPVEVIKEVEAEKPKGFINKVAWLLKD